MKPVKPQRMMPEGGGEPVPWPPIVLPQMGPDFLHRVAKDYVRVLDKELAAEYEDGTLKWGNWKRGRIREARAKWFQRGEGQDPHYEKFGTFRRCWGSELPTFRDVIIEERRRKEKELGKWESNAEHWRRHHMTRSLRVQLICKGWAKKYKSKQPKPPED